MSLENVWKASSSLLQAVRARLEPVAKGRSNAEAWSSGAWGSILARMRLPSQAPGRATKRRLGADETLRPAPPPRAAPTA